MDWASEWRRRIDMAHAEIPVHAPLKVRMQAIDAHAPSGMRGFSPYRSWLAARRAYLVRYGYTPRNSPPATDLERLMGM